MPQWAFEEGKVKETIRERIPSDDSLRVFKVTSGDSGKKYWVQILFRPQHHPRYVPICECQEAKFNLPLIIIGETGFWCKHAQFVMEKVYP